MVINVIAQDKVAGLCGSQEASLAERHSSKDLKEMRDHKWGYLGDPSAGKGNRICKTRRQELDWHDQGAAWWLGDGGGGARGETSSEKWKVALC